ncbi:MAG: glycosyltransferase family 4 protein [Saprospiraceae bacterium]
MSHSESNIDVVYIGRYNSGDNASGPEKAAQNIFYEHSKNNKTVFIEYFFDGRKYSIFKKLFGKETQSVSDNAEVYRLGLFRITPLLRKLKPRIIHLVTYERFEIVTLLYRVFSSVNVVYNIHGLIIYENNRLKETKRFYKWKDKVCEKLIIKHSGRLIFPSKQAVRKAKEFYNIDENKVSIIPHGVRNYSSVRIDNKILTGTIISNKIGFIKTIEFLNKIIDKVEFEFILNVIGDTSNIINNSKIKIIGYTKLNYNEFRVLLTKSEIFFSINQYDTFSISVAEAMASGCCVITTNETGMSGYINNKLNGFCVNFGDADTVIQILNELKDNQELRNNISNGASKIGGELNWNKVYLKYTQVYNDL